MAIQPETVIQPNWVFVRAWTKRFDENVRFEEQCRVIGNVSCLFLNIIF